ncbi:flagellar hook-length control protein FliK [Azoarcus sp. KH32C]|uniref:flagellar hook-length control protein FliK n=1 Tax=Azoarcus sp. KH32C TaxID=748247 RepID=UPI00023865CD|nr:flagellar hook-length control protein FliK [Azoarcus sp. KH32C]BAL23647.1 flagellar hook-length control protein [Azoarcus sp. KH32C]
MSNPLVSNLLQTNITSAANRSAGAERTVARDGSDTGQDFASALGRRIGSESGRTGTTPERNASEQANRSTRTDRNDDVQPQKSADSHDDGPRVARRPTREVQSDKSSQAADAPQGRSRAQAPSTSEGERRSDAARPSSAQQNPADDTNSTAPVDDTNSTADTAKDESPADVAIQAANTNAAVVATDDAASAEAPPTTQLPADTTAAANLAALLQGLAAQLPAAQPPQPGSGTTDGQTGTLPAGQGSSSHVLSTVLATLQRDGLGHMPLATGGKDDAAVATGTSPAGNASAGFGVPIKELAEPAIVSRSAQNIELLRSAPAEDSAANAAATPAPQSQLASTDSQTLGLQLANLAPAARSEATHVPQLPVHTQAGQAAWADDVGNRVVWMVGRNESKAELVLTPAHLGKLEISIQVSGDQTTAHFVAATAAARDALEQALPRLREVMQQAGINLGQTNVSTSSDQRARDERAATAGNSGGNGSNDVQALDEIRPATSSHWSRAALGMVDTFA